MHSSFLIVLLLFVCLIKQVSCISWFYLIMALLKKILIITVVVYALYTLWDRHLKCNMSSIISSVVSLLCSYPNLSLLGKNSFTMFCLTKFCMLMEHNFSRIDVLPLSFIWFSNVGAMILSSQRWWLQVRFFKHQQWTTVLLIGSVTQTKKTQSRCSTPCLKPFSIEIKACYNRSQELELTQ